MCGERKDTLPQTKIFDLSVCLQSVFLFVTFSCISYLSAHTSCAIGKAAHTLGQPA